MCGRECTCGRASLKSRFACKRVMPIVSCDFLWNRTFCFSCTSPATCVMMSRPTRSFCHADPHQNVRLCGRGRRGGCSSTQFLGRWHSICFWRNKDAYKMFASAHLCSEVTTPKIPSLCSTLIILTLAVTTTLSLFRVHRKVPRLSAPSGPARPKRAIEPRDH